MPLNMDTPPPITSENRRIDCVSRVKVIHHNNTILDGMFSCKRSPLRGFVLIINTMATSTTTYEGTTQYTG